MVHPRAFSFQIYLPTGEPSGLRIVDRTNWTGQGITFPRSRVAEAQQREELDRTGVYILWNRDDSDVFPQVYVGEAERVRARVSAHATDKSKDFWTDAVAFTTKDDSLDKAHAQYLEARLIQIAIQAGRCSLENNQTPAPPSMSEAKVADAERFLEDLLLCLPIVGAHFFQLPVQTDPVAPTVDGPVEMSIDYSQSNSKRLKGITARGYESADGFVILSGSLAVTNEAPKFAINFPKESSYRSQLIDQGLLIPHDGLRNAYRLTKDLVCNSPSRAAGIVLGGSFSGREEWKDPQGRSLNDLAKEDLPLDLQSGDIES
ncbi:MAG: GIY-YIG nuclease family protein [Chloroflexi bacterium]|nr:GIY-YIG nuclease family protein [Chloroflexota bacterium]